MALDDTDRRRFYLAALVSLIALPALWLVNRDDPAAGPSVATAGVDVGGQPSATSAEPPAPVTVESTIGKSNLPAVVTVGDRDPIFLDGPAPQEGGIAEIAVPSADGADSIFAQATYRSSVPGTNTCLAKNLQTGQTITVINLDNLRSATCRVSLAPATQQEELILHIDKFIGLADLTDAPISVQVRLTQ